MASLAKFGGPDLDSSVEFTYPNVWQRQERDGRSRLLIGAREREIPLMLELCRDFEGAFGVLYVLVASRCGHDDARYQSPEPVEFETLELFLYSFQEFFEQDGRHHLWVVSTEGEGQLIFDRHNLIYAYGDVDRYESRLRSAGFRPGPVAIPTPHVHGYHAEFDRTEDEVMSYWPWKKFPLEPDDAT
jgi:hypothetical protein